MDEKSRHKGFQSLLKVSRDGFSFLLEVRPTRKLPGPYRYFITTEAAATPGISLKHTTIVMRDSLELGCLL